jgi:DNA-directed DNA polymerase III PolC
MYINCKTYFSFRYGTIGTEELVRICAENGTTALALTNINNTCDAWDFVDFCLQQAIKPILGSEIRNEDQLLYILIAANNNGFAWINEFLSQHLLDKTPFPQIAAERPFFTDKADGYVIYPPGSKSPEVLFSNERIGVLPSEVNKLFGIDLKKHTEKFVVRQPVSFQNKTFYNVHRLLRAIDKNCLLSKLPALSQASADETFIPPDKLIAAFQQYPFIITNTYKLIDTCSIQMDFHMDKNKKTFTASKDDDKILLEKLAADGFKFRYGNNSVALKRLEKELRIIDELGFNFYFLCTWDIIRYASSRGFYYVGRGSGANSIVAYCLLITDVDPIELNLYFERFLNPQRTSPPDFDIDFSWLDRDEVIDYVFKRYGKKYVALLGMYSTFQYRAIIRELGKVFGLPKEEIDQLAEKSTAEDKIHRMILQYGKLIKDFPNHLSIHPGGILISEEPIYHYAALFMPPKGFATAQLDMFVAENIGLYKLDILSQRGLGHIKECLRLIKQNKGIDINIHEVEKFKKDPIVCAKIREADTIGCFYIESPAMRQLLKKLRCDDYLTLVAASSIIRPGVAQSGMMKQYIYRYHNPTKFEYLHPIMEELLKETFGVMVFQEDVIKVAHYFASLDLGEADILRRAMSGKYRSNNQFLLIKEKFFTNCEKLGHPDALAKEVWRQMESFAGYSFSKAHSASFAVESFQSLYLKTYYPKEFMVAVINNFGGFYSRELYFLELRKTGADIHLPCVNLSEYYSNIKCDAVYAGLVHIKSLQQELAEKMIEERNRCGSYQHLQDFIERTRITKEQLNILVSIAAFRFTGKCKKQLLWEANFLQAKNKTHVPASQSMFKEPPLNFTLPDLTDNPLDDCYDELEILDFPLRNPFELVNDDPYKYVLSKDLGNYLGKTVTVLIYFIDYKVVPTVNNQTMSFGTFIDANLDWVDTVHFPDAFRDYPLKGKGFYRVTGRVVEDFSVYSVEVHKMYKIGYKERKYANL